MDGKRKDDEKLQRGRDYQAVDTLWWSRYAELWFLSLQFLSKPSFWNHSGTSLVLQWRNTNMSSGSGEGWNLFYFNFRKERRQLMILWASRLVYVSKYILLMLCGCHKSQAFTESPIWVFDLTSHLHLWWRIRVARTEDLCQSVLAHCDLLWLLQLRSLDFWDDIHANFYASILKTLVYYLTLLNRGNGTHALNALFWYHLTWRSWSIFTFDLCDSYNIGRVTNSQWHRHACTLF